jgi:hypothetical protein
VSCRVVLAGIDYRRTSLRRLHLLVEGMLTRCRQNPSPWSVARLAPGDCRASKVKLMLIAGAVFFLECRTIKFLRESYKWSAMYLRRFGNLRPETGSVSLGLSSGLLGAPVDSPP